MGVGAILLRVTIACMSVYVCIATTNYAVKTSCATDLFFFSRGRRVRGAGLGGGGQRL